MSKPKLVFSSSAANRLRKLPKSDRARIIEGLSGELSALKSSKRKKGIVSIKGTKYIAVPSGKGVAVLRPMTQAEGSKYGASGQETFLVAELADSPNLVLGAIEEPKA